MNFHKNSGQNTNKNQAGQVMQATERVTSGLQHKAVRATSRWLHAALVSIALMFGFVSNAQASLSGYHDAATCTSIFGWAWDSSQPNTPINVDIYDGSTVIATVPANIFRQDLLNAHIGNGYHSFSINTPTSLINGVTHTITVKYSGTQTNLYTTPKSLLCTWPTTTSLGTTPNPSVAGQAVTMTASVTGSNPNGSSPTGTVTFKDGTTTLGTGSLSAGQATLNYNFAAGTHSLTAVYGGNAADGSSTSTAVSQTVNSATSTTTLSANANPSATTQSVALTATVTGYNPTGTVTFYDGTTAIGTGTLAAGTATLNYTFATTGTHSLTATYGGDNNNITSTSAAVSQTVMQGTIDWTASGTNYGQYGPPYVHNPQAMVAYYITTGYPSASTTCTSAPTALGQTCAVYAWGTTVGYTAAGIAADMLSLTTRAASRR